MSLNNHFHFLGCNGCQGVSCQPVMYYQATAPAIIQGSLLFCQDSVYCASVGAFSQAQGFCKDKSDQYVCEKPPTG